MTIWLHSAVFAATLAATTAIGVAGATYYAGVQADSMPKKADRLATLQAPCHLAFLGNMTCAPPAEYLTVESRPAGENLSVLTRVPGPAN